MSQLQCQQFQERLNNLLDRRESPREDATLAGHAANCQDCDRRLLTQELILHSLRRSDRPAIDGSRFVNSERWKTVVAVAAMIAVCFIVGRVWNNTTDSYEIASADPGIALPEIPEITGIAEITEETESHGTTDMISFQFDGAVETWHDFFATSTANTEWLEPVATPIRPLADSMTSTLNVLRQAIPTGRRMQKPNTNVEDSAARSMGFGTVA